MQLLRRLVARRSVRETEGALVAEGAKVLGEALASGTVIQAVYLDPAAGARERDVAAACHEAGARVAELDEGVMGRVCDVVTPQTVVGVVSVPTVSLGAFDAGPPDFVVVGVDVRDPGNAGTILRSADAAGAGLVVFCDGCVDAFNPKAVRASAGAVFHLPVLNGGVAPDQALDHVGGWGNRRLGTVARGGDDYSAVDLTARLALVLGNEAHGLPEQVAARLDGSLSIPMAGRAESLNVGMAAAVVCFEAARQRRLRGVATDGAAGAPVALGAP